MRKLLNLLLLLPILAISQSIDQNWVKTKIYKDSTKTSIPTPTPAQAVTQVSYFDGLGRTIQQVAHAQSNTGKDIVTHIEYDAFGRPAKEFLPYANQNASLNYNASAGTDVLGFYNTTGYENTSNPFSQKQFEASPLNRVLKQAAPGNAWSLGSGKEIKFDYQTNTANDVKLYKVTTTWNATLGIYDIALIETGYYAANQLYKTITYDENTPPSGASGLEEYKDKEGKVILKRTFNNSLAHETYYVYDIYGNLTYVIPPLVTSATTQLDGLCYQYKYDARNRLVEKKLPGKQWEYIVYDKLDRVVATGPAYNPWGGGDTNKGWLLTKYDVFNRPVFTAWNVMSVNSSSDRKKMQTGVDSSNILSESKTTATVTIDAVATKYTNTVFPTSFKLLTINYYDSYDFPNAPTIPTKIEGQNTQNTNLKGMPTGSWVRVLDNASSTTNETSYTVYDTRYRPIRSYTKNYLDGYIQVDTKLDWAGKIVYILTSQRRTTASELFTVKDRFEYTPQDRLTKHVQQLTSPTLLTEQLLTLNTYDELGQLTSKKVGGTDVTGEQALQAVDYSYNIRGWLKAINDVNNLGTDLFAFKINYNNPETATPLFNGNISETFWRTNSDNIKRKYNYSYDGLNRLLQANYSKPDAGTNLNNYKEWLNYDANGNITDIVRTGFIDPVAGTVENVIDNLKFVYDTASQNRLLKVNDLSNSPQGFKDNYTSSANDFTYDNNGNMTADNNKGIVSITYNHLNLPIKLNFGAKGEITYLYNAAGQKLQKFVKDIVSNTNTTTDYLSGFQYLNTTLQFFPHAEGYVHYTRPLSNSQLGSFNYVFNYTDHLGNVRVSFANDPLQGNVLKILEENHYYAFGMKHENYNVTRLNFKYYPETGVELVPLPAVANASYNYKYNGKELQEELGLNMYDYGARNYDPSIGRWNVMDGKGELYFDKSPYVYALNTPLQAIDPDGNVVIFINGMHFGSGGKAEYWRTYEKQKRYNPTPFGYVESWETVQTSAFDTKVMNHFGDQNAMYKDGRSAMAFYPGDIGSIFDPYERSNSGYHQGKKDAEGIIANLARDKTTGEIVETIKIITHSMGSAYGKGYVKALQEYIKKLPKEQQSQIKISVADFDPFQAGSLEANKDVYTQQFTHLGGFWGLAEEKQKGVDDYTESKGAHSISSFIGNINNLKEGTYKWNGSSWVCTTCK